MQSSIFCILELGLPIFANIRDLLSWIAHSPGPCHLTETLRIVYPDGVKATWPISHPSLAPDSVHHHLGPFFVFYAKDPVKGLWGFTWCTWQDDCETEEAWAPECSDRAGFPLTHFRPWHQQSTTEVWRLILTVDHLMMADHSDYTFWHLLRVQVLFIQVMFFTSQLYWDLKCSTLSLSRGFGGQLWSDHGDYNDWDVI